VICRRRSKIHDTYHSPNHLEKEKHLFYGTLSCAFPAVKRVTQVVQSTTYEIGDTEERRRRTLLDILQKRSIRRNVQPIARK